MGTLDALKKRGESNQADEILWGAQHQACDSTARAAGFRIAERRVRQASLLLLALLGCDRSGLRSLAGEVEVSPRALHFETAFVGFSGQRSLILRNTSRSDRALTVTRNAPFGAAPQVIVPGGSELELQVQFMPTASGPIAGNLVVSDGAAVFEIAVDGTGALPPTCTATSACHESTFDPARGTCVEALAADGSRCVTDNACFLGGQCARGVCLGTGRDCSDFDRCTIDACEPSGGCLHLPATCATPANPCKVARCDPALGCVEADANDGTACGVANCATARVCMLGECKTLPVPDGAVCAPATACQGAGTCQQHSCERPPATPLTEAWSYDFPGGVPGFHGVSDAADNLYWVECAFGGLADVYCNACTLCAATSYTRDGALRFRKILNGAIGYELEPLHLLLGARLIYAMPYSVGAMASTDGALQWSRDFYGPLPGAPDTANFFQVTALAADATGVLVIARRYQNNAQSPRQSVVLELDPASGATVYTRFFDGELTGAVVDEQNNLYFGFSPRTSPNPPAVPPQLVSLSASGAERWRVTVTEGTQAPLAAYGTEVILAGGEVRATLDGTKRAGAAGGWVRRNALMAPASRTLLRDPPFECCPQCSCPPPLPRLDAIGLAAGSAAVEWTTTIASANGVTVTPRVSDTVASGKSELLVAGASSLFGLTAQGAIRFTCEIPQTLPAQASTSSFDSPVALLHGRWAVVETIECPGCLVNPPPRLRVLEVPGETPALHGWVGARGAASGAGRSLP